MPQMSPMSWMMLSLSPMLLYKLMVTTNFQSSTEPKTTKKPLTLKKWSW